MGASEQERHPRPDLLDILVLVFLVAAEGVALYEWLRADAVPNGFQNEFHHLLSAQQAWALLADLRFGALLPALFADYYPPLLDVVGMVALTFTRGAEDLLAGTNLLWLALLLVSTWGLAEAVVGRRAGIAAAALVAVLPAIVGNARYFEPNTALPATCTATLCALAVAGDRRRRWLVAGALGGLALLADRLTAAPVLAGAVLWTLAPLVVGAAADAGTRRRAARQLLHFAGPAAVLVLPWFVCWLVVFLPEIAAQVGGEITYSGEQTEQRSLLSPSTWLWYPLTLVHAQAGLAAGAVALVGGVGFLATERRPAARPVVGALGLTLLLLSVVLKKQAYYSQPILPLAAVCAVWLLWRLPWPALRWVALAPLVASTVLLTAEGSTGHLLRPDTPAWDRWARPVDEALIEPQYPQIDTPDGEIVSLDAVATALRDEGVGEDDVVLLYSEGQLLYEYAALSMLRFRLRRVPVEAAAASADAFHAAVPQASWFVYVSADPGRRWPDEESVTAMMVQQRLVDERLATLLADLDALEQRARLRASWPQNDQERVHLHALH